MRKRIPARRGSFPQEARRRGAESGSASLAFDGAISTRSGCGRKGRKGGRHTGVEWGGLARILWPRATVFEHTPVVIDRGRLTRSLANEPSPRSSP